MKKFDNKLTHNNEIIFGSSDADKAQQIARDLKAGKIRKLCTRVYSSNLTDSPSSIIKRNRYLIIGQLFPNALISHRSAIEA